jgi:hypothetical protein
MNSRNQNGTTKTVCYLWINGQKVSGHQVTIVIGQEVAGHQVTIMIG